MPNSCRTYLCGIHPPIRASEGLTIPSSPGVTHHIEMSTVSELLSEALEVRDCDRSAPASRSRSVAVTVALGYPSVPAMATMTITAADIAVGTWAYSRQSALVDVQMSRTPGVQG